MSLKEKMRNELSRHAQSGISGSPIALNVSEDQRQLMLELSEIGPVGCAFNRLV
jgi:hypothetical protein